MGIHGDARFSESIAQHHVGGLAPDAGQADQGFQGIRHLAAEFFHQLAATADHRLCLVAVEAGRPDFLFQRRGIGRRKVRRGPVFLEQVPAYFVHARIGTLRRKNHRDQEFEGVGIIQGKLWLGIVCQQPARHFVGFRVHGLPPPFRINDEVQRPFDPAGAARRYCSGHGTACPSAWAAASGQ